MAEGPLQTKSVYDPPAAADGTRVLVMRFWPRGVSRKKVDLWMRELGTSPDLIRQWKTSSISWPQFRRKYRQGLQNPGARQAITQLRKQLAQGPVTLLCGCPDESRCHRSILREVILQQLVLESRDSVAGGAQEGKSANRGVLPAHRKKL